jgi:hypothetical protein
VVHRGGRAGAPGGPHQRLQSSSERDAGSQHGDVEPYPVNGSTPDVQPHALRIANVEAISHADPEPHSDAQGDSESDCIGDQEAFTDSVAEDEYGKANSGPCRADLQRFDEQ